MEIGEHSDLFYWIKIQIMDYEKLSHVQKLYLGKNKTTIHCFLPDVRYMQDLLINFKVIHIIASKERFL